MSEGLGPWITAGALGVGVWLGDRLLRYLERRGFVYYRGER
jgi:hypothetical protein